MKCDHCGAQDKRLTTERVPSGFGYTCLKQICDDCLGELQDYWESKREEKRMKNE